MRSEWAEALATSGKADNDSIKLLLSPLSSSSLEPGQLQEHVLPALVYLEQCGGQHVEPLLGALCTKLQQLASTCDEPAKPNNPALYAQMLTSLGSVMRSNDLSLSSRTQLSAAVEVLVQASIQQAMGREGGQAATIGDCLIRGEMMAHEPALPLLPSSAGKLLTWVLNTLLVPMATASAPPTTANLEGILHCTIAAAHAANPAVVAARTASGPLSADACDEGVLMEVLEWSRRVMQRALAGVTADESEASPHHVSGELTRGAAQLCVATAGALVYADVSPSLPSFYAASETAQTRGSKPSFSSASRRFDSRAESFRSTCSTAPFEAGEVLDDLLCLVDTCVAAALAGTDEGAPVADAATRNKVLGSVAGMMEGVGAVLAWAAEQGTPISSYLSQIKSMLLSIATGTATTPAPTPRATNPAVPRPETAETISWAWDLHRPLPESLYRAAGGAVGPAGAGQLLLLLAETLSQGLVAAWQNGQRPVVHALLLPPEPAVASPSDVKVMTLVAGRVYILLEAETELSGTVLPLLLDSWASCLAAPAAAGGFPGASIQPDVFACVTTTLSDMSAWSAVCRSREGSASPPYNQVSNILLRMYRDTCVSIRTAKATSPPTLQRLHVVSNALATMGDRLASDAHAVKMLQALQFRLLSLFNDLGLIFGEAGPSEPLAVLLPAVAAASVGGKGLGGGGGGGGGGDSSAGFATASTVKYSYADLALTYKQDTNLMKLFRKFWLLVASHGLATGPLSSAVNNQALGCIATATPLMMVALGSGGDDDIQERLKAELGELLAALGRRGDAAKLKSTLLATYPHHPPKDCPTAAEALGHLLAVGTCELARATFTALPSPGSACPLSVTLAYLQFSSPRSIYCAWYAHMVKHIYHVYLQHISTASQHSTQPHGPSATTKGFKLPSLPQIARSFTLPRAKQHRNGGEGARQLLATPAECQEGKEQLAVTLISHLASTQGAERAGVPKVVEVSWELLQSLIDGDKGSSKSAGGSDLLYSPACWQTFLSMLQLEESDKLVGSSSSATTSTASAARGGSQSILWRTLTVWVERAALAAPEKTEALLHHFMNQASVPAAVSRTRTDSLTSAHSTPTNTFAAASAAATRRAADLLGIASKARAKSYLSVGEAKLNTTLELCRKQYYLGLVRGLASGSNTDAAAAQVLDGLKAAVRNPHTPVADLHTQYLSAAAVLVIQEEERLQGRGRAAEACATLEEVLQDDVAGDQACLSDPINLELLQLLVSVPLAKFNADMMSLAVFAWTWVAASGPAWLLPLTSRTMSGFCQSVDEHVGLFSGHWTPVPKTGMDAALDLEVHDGKAPVAENVLVERLSCHYQWIIHLTEVWQTTHNRVDSVKDTILWLLHRTLNHALADPHRLSSHPAAAALRYRLLQLALKVFLEAAKHGSPSTADCILMDKAIRAGLLWYLHPASYSSHLSQDQSEEQYLSIGDFTMMLDKLLDVLKASGRDGRPLGGRTEVYRPGEHGSSRLESSLGPAPPAAASSSGPAANKPGGLLTVRVVQLLKFLGARESDRLQVWAKPRASGVESASSDTPSRSRRPWESAALAPLSSVGAKEWKELVDTAWEVSPQLAVSLAGRFPGIAVLRKLVVQQLVRDVWRSDVQELPDAALLLATSEALSPSAPELWALAAWAPGDAALGLQLISSPAGKIPVVKEYAVRCLHNTPPDKVTFFLSQLVQCLREDADGAIASALKLMADRSDLFAHQLVWALRTEQKPPDEAMNPEVKRSGWQPPRDYGLWDVSGQLCNHLLAGLSPERMSYFEAEERYFDRVTSISGILKPVEKDKRKAAIAVELSKFSVPRPDLYIPTNPHCRVIKHIPTSGTPMQSAAKVPILVAFKVEDLDQPVPDIHAAGAAAAAAAAAAAGGGAGGGGGGGGGGVAAGAAGGKGLSGGMHRSAAGQQLVVASGQAATGQAGAPENGSTAAAAAAVHNGDACANGNAAAANGGGGGGGEVEGRTLACIFKVGDDVRQDVLALQVIKLLEDAFHAAGLPAYLKPYGCLPTGYERGIIEVVPHTRSRAALGEVSDSGLYDFFQAEFGDPGSPVFESARQNFIISAAGYAIASFLLQAKDRHNGNLLISNEGHLVHIDFGFILEISPGGNLGFESAAFKLSHEMTQLIDPGGARDSATWAQFEELCIRAYLVARTVAEPIIATVALMSKSGLPCFGRGHPIQNLRNRFHLEMSERQAAAFMRGIINDAYQKWTTGFYDYIQALQNRIPY